MFPKFYRSPYLSRKESLRDTDDTEPPSESSEIAMPLSPSESQRIARGDEKPEERPPDPDLLDRFALRIIQVRDFRSVSILPFAANSWDSLKFDIPFFSARFLDAE